MLICLSFLCFDSTASYLLASSVSLLQTTNCLLVHAFFTLPVGLCQARKVFCCLSTLVLIVISILLLLTFIEIASYQCTRFLRFQSRFVASKVTLPHSLLCAALVPSPLSSDSSVATTAAVYTSKPLTKKFSFHRVVGTSSVHHVAASFTEVISMSTWAVE